MGSVTKYRLRPVGGCYRGWNLPRFGGTILLLLRLRGCRTVAVLACRLILNAVNIRQHATFLRFPGLIEIAATNMLPRLMRVHLALISWFLAKFIITILGVPLSSLLQRPFFVAV